MPSTVTSPVRSASMRSYLPQANVNLKRDTVHPPDLSFRLDAGILDHLGPFLDLGRDERLELLRRTGQRLDGDCAQPVLHITAANEARQHRVELVDDRAWRPGPRHQREPPGRRIARQSGFRDGRKV